VALHVQQYEEEMCFKRDAATNEEQGEWDIKKIANNELGIVYPRSSRPTV
jgi:hypothetical protein